MRPGLWTMLAQQIFWFAPTIERLLRSKTGEFRSRTERHFGSTPVMTFDGVIEKHWPFHFVDCRGSCLPRLLQPAISPQLLGLLISPGISWFWSLSCCLTPIRREA